jgi:hypothetical protein
MEAESICMLLSSSESSASTSLARLTTRGFSELAVWVEPLELLDADRFSFEDFFLSFLSFLSFLGLSLTLRLAFFSFFLAPGVVSGSAAVLDVAAPTASTRVCCDCTEDSTKGVVLGASRPWSLDD